MINQNQLVESYRDYIYRQARLLTNNRDDIEDLVQDTLLALCKYSCPSSGLARVILKRIHYRKFKRYPIITTELKEDSASSVDDYNLDSFLFRKIMAGIASPKLREIAELIYSGKNYTETRRELKIANRTYYRRLQKLREYFNEHK